MSAAVKPLPARPIRVAVRGAGRAALERLVREAGHTCVVLQEEADVVLEGEGSAAELDAVLIGAAVRAAAAGVSLRTTSGFKGFAAMAEDAFATLLTPRELEVLELLGAGRANKEIARLLGISLHTVKFHLEALFRKLGVRTRTEAAAKLWERRREALEL